MEKKKSEPEKYGGGLPCLELDDGSFVTQSNAMLRYAGKKSGLYPKDDKKAMVVDMAIDILSDILNSM